jgi:ketosteroid isomerase-like protein
MSRPGSVGPVSAGSPAHGPADVVPSPGTAVTEQQVSELVARMDEAAKAYINGDIRRYLALFDHPDDYSLMPPYGGDTQIGFAPTEEDLDRTSRFFVSGEADLEVHATYASGDLVVLVGVERQHGVVGDPPDQDWSLRVTIVFRRVGDRWQILHRHADPLVEEIGWSEFARLARGAEPHPS